MRLTVRGLAKALDRPYPGVYEAIRRGSLPIGTAYKVNENYSFELFPEKIRELYGTDILNQAYKYSTKGAK